MKGIGTILFLVTIPFIMAIGYDIFLNIQNQESELKLTAVGFILIQNAPDVFKSIRDSVSPEQWTLLNNYIFEQKTILVTGVFAALFYVIAGLIKFLSGGIKTTSIRSGVKNKKVNVILGDEKNEKYKYKRK